MTLPMPSPSPASSLQLQSGALACVVEPALGACLRSLTLGTLPVLRPSPADLPTARQAGSYPLVPCSNRVANARLAWNGRTWPLTPNNPPEPHAIHGIGWQRAWTVVRHDGASALLALDHPGDASWPFAFRCEQALRIEPQALVLELALTNRAPEPAPAGLGWHPFFVKRPGARLQVATTARWQMGEDKLPTVRTPDRGIDQPCDTLDVDHCFDGWDGQAELVDDALAVRVTSSLRHVVVFTNPSRAAVAIEPVSHANNVFGEPALGEGLPPGLLGRTALAPGETLRAWMRIEVHARGA
ncbi:aldose 1-epimerase [Ramlibacter sp. MAH-25]|uniref:Aldose 1-epimerase n=2 Tax=Comamonadaceae TaxID=80864 RepID=A0A6N8IZC7_9BURK|nr:aldose 1-epimerase [Ramlibacter pinisoli]